MGYPKYRVKGTLNENYEYTYQPQIKEYLVFDWHNLLGRTKVKTKLTTSVDDINDVQIGRSHSSTIEFTTELGVQMVIKKHYLDAIEENKLTIENKDKKKVIINMVNPEEL